MEHYKRTELLGQGTYGKVYKAQHIETGKVVALKKTFLSKDDEGVPATTLREVSILRSLDSPYVVKYVHCILFSYPCPYPHPCPYMDMYNIETLAARGV